MTLNADHLFADTMKTNWGFTLIELLLVVVIVAVLAGLLLATLSLAKAKARVVGCQSNLRQIGLGLGMYATDSRRFPPVSVGSPSGSNSQYWLTLIQPYTQAGWTSAVMHCPADKTPNSPPSSGVDGVVDGYVSYGYNWLGTGVQRPQNNDIVDYLGLENRLEDAVNAPVDMVALYHSASWFRQSSEGPWPHRDGANLSFCDNHVLFIPFTELWSSNINSRARWNYDHDPHRETWQGR
jgi:prepilin-type N-terminal cleavage/methylation domain-containing protein/prepilin-type processing-associated H-X9-DG protein